ncbi:MAG TPA: FAD binding domain-containing protein [Trebonia sp.]|nr:FAD binding domain-containing protein [Trebonia sp.]
MKPAPFEYHAPASARQAVELLAELGDGAKLIAGGQSLIPLLALRLAAFEHLVDLRKVSGLREIVTREGTLSDGAIWIGAGTTEAAIGRSALVAAKVPLLARATPLIGHFQIRNRGTLGGSLAHADAAAEYPAVALALDAVIETLSPRGQRTIPAAQFFTGIWSTALEPDELLTGVTFRALTGRAGFAIEEFARRPGDFAVAGAAVAVELDAAGAAEARIRRCGIGLFGLGQTPLRASAVEASLVGVPAADLRTDARAREIGQAAMADLESVPSDLHGPASYRKRVGAAVVAAAWRRAIDEAVAGAVADQHRGALGEEAASG